MLRRFTPERAVSQIIRIARTGSQVDAAHLPRIVRYARQSATRFYARQFELPFNSVYRLLSIQADGQKDFSDEIKSTCCHGANHPAA